MQAELILEAKTLLGEGPVWDERQNLLYWVDIQGMTIHTYNPADSSDSVIRVGQSVGCVALTQSGGLAAALKSGIHTIENQKPQIFAENPEKDILPKNRFNDGKPDFLGNLWVGTVSSGHESGAGALYRVSPQGEFKKILDKVSLSNGLSWSTDNQYMYHIDSGINCMTRYLFDIETGDIFADKEIVRHTDSILDGMTIDSNGNIWVAAWDGFAVYCYDSFTGELLQEIEVPVPRPSCCTFGGEDLDTLYITTAVGGNIAVARDYPLSGSLFCCKPGVKGLLANRFDI